MHGSPEDVKRHPQKKKNHAQTSRNDARQGKAAASRLYDFGAAFSRAVFRFVSSAFNLSAYS